MESVKKNSYFNHQLIIHINEGSDGTYDYVKKNNYEFTYSEKNIGMPKALNTASKLSKYDYILISHDDFYFCPDWDKHLINEVKSIGHNDFYISGTMIAATDNDYFDNNVFPPIFNAGSNFKNFNESKLIKNLEKIAKHDFQGTTKCPGLVHKNVWEKVNGWSEEFFPTGGDDSDFAMKLWINNVRIFKGVGKSLVYHFGSITTRKKSDNLFTYNGSRGNKIFIKKWKFSINFFEKYYLKSGIDRKGNFIFNKYEGPLKNPEKSIRYFVNYLKCKLNYFYLLIINFK